MIIKGEEVVQRIVAYLKNVLPDSERIWRFYTSWEEGKQFIAGFAYLVVILNGENREYGTIGTNVLKHQMNISLYFAVSSGVNFIKNFEDRLVKEIFVGLQNDLKNTFNAYFFTLNSEKNYLEEYRYHAFRYDIIVETFETIP